MRIDRWFELNCKSEDWRDVFQKSLAHTLPNGLQFYDVFGEPAYFLVDKDMLILCKIYTDKYDIFVREM